jgi:glycosyltransferase involved in cell wall biosynthesis
MKFLVFSIMKNKITVLLTTCDRYNTTLPICLSSILSQTRLPDEIVIVDDSRNNSFYQNDAIKQLLVLSKLKNVEINYFYGEKRGAVPALQIGLNNISDGWVLKTDDDNYLNPDVLEKFESFISEGVGAMSCLIIDKDSIIRDYNTIDVSSNIEDIYSHFNIQMVGIQDNTIKEVEHLYSNYFFNRTLADDYPKDLFPSSIREETIFTYNIFRKGYKLLVIPDIKIYHLKDDKKTGNRQWSDEHELKNEKIFLKYLEDCKIIPDKIQLYENEKIVFTKKNEKDFLVYKKY